MVECLKLELSSGYTAILRVELSICTGAADAHRAVRLLLAIREYDSARSRSLSGTERGTGQASNCRPLDHLSKLKLDEQALHYLRNFRKRKTSTGYEAQSC